MADENISVVLQEKMKLILEDKPIPKPGNDEVQIAMHSVGICGSDVHFWRKGAIGEFVVKSPMKLGHESSGIISEVGSNVKHLKIGDRVAIEPQTTCGSCRFCKGGRYNLCADVKFHATPPFDGTLARYIVHNADLCFKIPDNMSLEEGALCEPLSVGIHACRRGNVSLGHKVLITGAGPIGLVSMLSAKAMGASEICVTDISAERLEFAKKMGADHTLLIDTQDVDVLSEKVQTAFGVKADVTIECSGAQSSLELAIYSTANGGCIILVGMGPEKVTVPLLYAACHEIDIRGIFRYANTWPTAISMISSGAVNVKPLVTHHFPIEDALKAFETASTGAGGAIKVIIDCFKK
ncbi:sorbitol dehydrogenase-like [Tubulanus polymorphus]|uniref:sorbitol dehydrogenase-like n=1 Tax=Tubulanus polymorphus TaxID=672921 RepID=UPI003DA2AD56